MGDKCRDCCKPSDRADKAFCSFCAKRRNAAAAARRQRLTAEGRCDRCGAPAESNRKKCRPCLDKLRTAFVATYVAKKAEGVCTVPGCRKPPGPGRLKCVECAADVQVRRKSVYRDRYTAGLCRRCGKKQRAEGRLACDGCAKAAAVQVAKHRRLRISTGLCCFGGCKSPPDGGTLMCRAHRTLRNQRYRRGKREGVDGGG